MESCDIVIKNSYTYRFIRHNYPFNINKFARLPFSGSCCASTLSLTTTTTRRRRRRKGRELPPLMETPPAGYRRNVGICLFNAYKKVNCITLLCMTLLIDLWLAVLILDFSGLDIYCVKDKYTGHVADASGTVLDKIFAWFFCFEEMDSWISQA